MGQTTALIMTLKRALKAQGKTYQDVAEVLQLSEASVKRLFSDQNFSLTRLDQVCQMLSMDIADLVKMMEAQSTQLEHLNIAQEKEICQDLTLLLVTVCLLNHWKPVDIMAFYHIDKKTCIQKLAHLDRLKIIDLLPKNRIKLKVATNFHWIENGPIQRFFLERIASEYFHTRFNQEDEQLIVLNGMLSKASNSEFQRKMKRLATSFDLLNQEDAGHDFDQRHGTTVVLAMRGWQYGLFQPFIKNND